MSLEAVSMRALRTGIGAALAHVGCLLAGACESSGGGTACYPPAQGPSDPSCSGFGADLSCPVALGSWYTCVCTDSGSAKTWVCNPADSTGMGGMGGGGSATGDAG